MEVEEEKREGERVSLPKRLVVDWMKKGEEKEKKKRTKEREREIQEGEERKGKGKEYMVCQKPSIQL